MDKLMFSVLPKDILITVFDYLLYPTYIDNSKFPKYEYVINTFTKNISYVKNKHLLIPEMRDFVGHMLQTVNNNSYLNVCDIIVDSSNMGVVKYLCEKLTSQRMMHDMTSAACKLGRLNVLKFLVKKIRHVGYERYFIHQAFRHASAHGHLRILRYIVSKFNFTSDNKDNYKINFKHVLQIVCGVRGDVKMLKYLSKIFGLTRDDLDIDEILYDIFRNGHFKMLKHVVDVFKLNSENVCRMMRVGYIFKVGNFDRNFEMFKYIMHTFNLSIPRCVIIDMYNMAYWSMRDEVLKYMVDAFHMTPEEML